MSGFDVKYPYVDEHDFSCDNLMRQTQDRFIESVQKATAQAIAEGIKVNSILINKNMVKVPTFFMRTPDGRSIMTPPIFCGLNVYLTEDELSEGYSFAVLEGPSNRLAEFESIGMDPGELRKAAELYRRIKEVME